MLCSCQHAQFSLFCYNLQDCICAIVPTNVCRCELFCWPSTTARLLPIVVHWSVIEAVSFSFYGVFCIALQIPFRCVCSPAEGWSLHGASNGSKRECKANEAEWHCSGEILKMIRPTTHSLFSHNHKHTYSSWCVCMSACVCMHNRRSCRQLCCNDQLDVHVFQLCGVLVCLSVAASVKRKELLMRHGWALCGYMYSYIHIYVCVYIYVYAYTHDSAYEYVKNAVG